MVFWRQPLVPLGSLLNVTENAQQGTDGADSLIVMYGSRSWRVAPGETFTFGRSRTSPAVLHADDRGVSRTAGSPGTADY